MFRSLLPKSDHFFGFFEKQAAISVEAAQNLVMLGSSAPSVDIFKNIKALEHEADNVTHQCIEAIHKTFITPVDRLDLYRLITTLDDIVDEIEDIAKLIVLYKLPNLNGAALRLAEILVSSIKEVELAVKEFRKMKITESLRSHFFTINHLENEADILLYQALARLFDEEKDPISLIKWKEIYEHLEHGTDVCEDVANILEGIVLENE